MPPSIRDLTTFKAMRSRKEYRRGTPGRPPVACTDGVTKPISSQYRNCRDVHPVNFVAWCVVNPSMYRLSPPGPGGTAQRFET